MNFLLEISKQMVNEDDGEKDELDRDYLQAVEVDLHRFESVSLVAKQGKEQL